MSFYRKPGSVRKTGPSFAQKKAYGIAASRACEELGIRGAKECQEYRRKVVAEVSGREKFSDVRSNADVDLIMQRLWTDAGDYMEASKFCVNYERQMAYVIKVLAVQIMQLKGGDERVSRDYVSGILNQAKIANGFVAESGDFWMDIRTDQVQSVLTILDTERRRVLMRFGSRAGAFCDRIKYSLDGPILTRQDVPRGYYERMPFKATVRAA